MKRRAPTLVYLCILVSTMGVGCNKVAPQNNSLIDDESVDINEEVEEEAEESSQNKIEEYKEKYSEKVDDSIMIIGSDTDWWSTIETDLQPLKRPIINISINDSSIQDWISDYIHQLVEEQNPLAVICSFNNDKLVKSSSIEECIETYESLVEQIHVVHADTQIYIVKHHPVYDTRVENERLESLNNELDLFVNKYDFVKKTIANWSSYWYSEEDYILKGQLFEKDNFHLNNTGKNIYKANVRNSLGDLQKPPDGFDDGEDSGNTHWNPFI